MTEINKEIIPFNKPYMTGRELDYIAEAHINGQLAGDGPFTQRCETWLETTVGCRKALLTNSCTAALEMAAILADLQPGDEVIMPSYTFVSTANAFVLRGAIPVFVDIRADTANIDEQKIEQAITPKTKAIVPVHYAGVACEMDTIMAIAVRHDLLVIEDAAQGICSSYKGRPLGSIGHLAAFSFHETKNIISGEGGALLINDDRFTERAEIIREKGTNRKKFFRGQVDKYSWVDIGSSFLTGEVTAAFLWAQMEQAQIITDQRLAIWNSYHESFSDLESSGAVRRPVIPADCSHNAHMYYLLINDNIGRAKVIAALKQNNIHPTFHYVPLHNSTMGTQCSRTPGNMDTTCDISARLLRLPLWLGIEDKLPLIINTLLSSCGAHNRDNG
jgi:dTDP-4-amino-4,6-dideoxygalactose transaminase